MTDTTRHPGVDSTDATGPTTLAPEMIGPEIARHRQGRNWTQRELGERMGVGTSLVAKWEQGIRIPPHEWLVEIDRVLGTNLAELSPPSPRRRGPRPAAGRLPSVNRPSAFNTPVLIEVSNDGVRAYHGDHELEAIVLDLRQIDEAPPSERVRRISELLLRSLDLPQPLSDRLVRRLTELG